MASLSGSAKYVMLQGMQVELPPSLAKVLEVPTGVLDGPGAWFLIESMLAPLSEAAVRVLLRLVLGLPSISRTGKLGELVLDCAQGGRSVDVRPWRVAT